MCIVLVCDVYREDLIELHEKTGPESINQFFKGNDIDNCLNKVYQLSRRGTCCKMFTRG